MSAFHDNVLIGASGQQGYKISRSVRLRSSASAYLNRTLTTPTNNKIWTYSFWYKRGTMNDGGAVGGTKSPLFDAPSSANTFDTIYIRNADNIVWYEAAGGATICYLETTPVFRDPSAWYHFVIVYDSAQATEANRQKIYVNNVQITAFSTAIYVAQNTNGRINSAVAHKIGSSDAAGTYLDGYLTEINFIDGQALTPSSFGQTNAVTGVWQPKKYAGTYGTNGFYLNFSDNSGATATTIGKDNSGNGNNWTPNNVSVTAGVTYDSMLDVPTLYADGGNGRGNYATLNPLDKATSFTTAGGNLNFTPANTSDLYSCRSTIQIPSTGKWIWEVRNTNSTYMITAGLLSGSTPTTGQQTVTCAGMTVGSIGTFFSTTQWMNTTTTWSVTNIGNGDTLVIAYDADAGKIWFGRVASGGSTVTFYNTSGTADPSTGTDPRASGIVAGGWFAGFGTYFTPSGASANFGQRPFAFTNIPTGFKALNTQNLPTPTISNGASYMAATLYTGNGGSQSIANTVNGVSMQPDFVWVKKRSGAENHELTDAVRGNNLRLASNTTDAQSAGGIAMASTGFALSGGFGTDNENAQTYVGWQWNAGGSTVTNTSGSISAQVRANTTAGFSVVTYTGTGANATVGHGLGVAPNMIIIKNRSSAVNWIVYHSSLGNTKELVLNSTAAEATNSDWNNTSPTSTVFSLGVSGSGNGSGNNLVAYCFAAVAGYSAFGSYTGNGSADGPFVFTNFQPRWLMIKRTDSTGAWFMYDDVREPFNPNDSYINANTASAEDTNNSTIAIDFVSNGFKNRGTSTGTNSSGSTYIYAAFAENPFKLSLAR